MDESTAAYVRCGARLSQGDIVRAPVSVLARARDLSPEGTGLTVPIPPLQTGAEQVLLRLWDQLAVVVSPDCGIEKENEPILVAPLFPPSAYAQNALDGIRAGTALAAFLLPAADDLEYLDGSHSVWPEAVVNLARITAVTQGLIIPQRLTALGPSQLDRLQERLIRYFALKEISSTGTIEAMTGRTIQRVRVLDSSKHRHTVELTLDDGGLLVLYQEPRRARPQLEAVAIKDGCFSRSRISAVSSTKLVLRFENEDLSDHRIEWLNAGLDPIELSAARTREVTVQCPDGPCALVIRNRDSGEMLTIQVAGPEASPLS